MKKLVLALALLATSSTVLADGHRGWDRGYGGAYHHDHHNDWVGPMIGGAVIGAVIYDIYNRPRVVQQPQVVYVQPTPEPIYQYQDIYDRYCNCYRRVLVQIN